MRYIEFIVNDITLDISPEQIRDTLGITYAIASFKDLGKGKGVGSKTIRVTRTKKIEQAFGITYNSTVTTSINKSVAQPLLIKENSQIIVDGFAKLMQSTETEIEFVVFSNNATLKTILGDATLNDLNLTDLYHLYSNSVIFDTWDSTYPAGVPEDFFYPLIDYGGFYTRSGDDAGTPTIGSDLYPAVYVRRIISQIFKDAGLTLSSTFFDRVEMFRLLLIFSNKEFVHPPSWVNDRLFRASTSVITMNPYDTGYEDVEIDDDSTGNNFDNGSNFDTATYTYTVTEGVIMSFVVNVEIANIVNPGAPTQQSVALVINGVTTPPAARVDFAANGTYTFALTDFEFVPGDTIKVMAADTAAGGSFDIVTCSIYNSVSAAMLPDSTVDLAYNLPNIKQIDFVRHCIQMFNWQVDIDYNTRRATIETFKDFILDPLASEDNSVEWTGKLGSPDGVTVKYVDDNIPKTYGFSYEENDSDYVNDFNAANKGRWLFGDGQYETGNDFKAEVENVTDLPYAATFIGKSYINPADRYINIPSVIKDLDNVVLSTDIKPRMLIYAGNISVSSASDRTYINLRINDGALTLRNNIPLCYFVKTSYANANPPALDIDASKVNLAFSLPESDDNWNGHGLVDEFYEPQLKNYNDLRVIEALLNLKGTDINQLSFRKPPYINAGLFTGYYILSQVENYNPLNDGLTKVELIKIT